MTHANLQVVDYTAAGSPCSDDMAVLAAPLSIILTQELDGASVALGVSVDALLVAALGRAIARTIGEGTIELDLELDAAEIDAVELDESGDDCTVNPISLACVGPELSNATKMLAHVRHTVAAAILQRIVHGVADAAPEEPTREILFAHGSDPARLGHALEVHAHRCGDVMALDWWFDTRSFEPYTVQELSEQFPFALIELTSEATDPVRATEMAMAY